MIFYKDEKVFSLSGTSDITPINDISKLWSEFFSYLLIGGFYLEGDPCGEGKLSIVPTLISDEKFTFTEGAYNQRLGKMISSGLQNRFISLMNHRDITEDELVLLGELNGIFAPNIKSYYKLSAEKIYSISKSRNFSSDDDIIAYYVSQTFGQIDFLSDKELPVLYISMFGNIHLSKRDYITISKPTMIFASMANTTRVTALWSFLSAQVDSLIKQEDPGNRLALMLPQYSFVSSDDDYQKNLTVPRFAASLYIQAILGIDPNKARYIPSVFYHKFLYGHIGNIDISRKVLLNMLLDLMVEKMGYTHRSHLFQMGSIYSNLDGPSSIYDYKPRRSYILDYALESLDDNQNVLEDTPEKTGEDDNIEKDVLKTPESKNETKRLPSVEDGGYDPSISRPSSTVSELTDEDIIDLISFDKTSEGVAEDLYRSAVVALNDRLKTDSSINVPADVKESLNFWVNGYLYRAAISATKERITSLNLQDFLKDVLI